MYSRRVTVDAPPDATKLHVKSNLFEQNTLFRTTNNKQIDYNKLKDYTIILIM